MKLLSALLICFAFTACTNQQQDQGSNCKDGSKEVDCGCERNCSCMNGK